MLGELSISCPSALQSPHHSPALVLNLSGSSTHHSPVPFCRCFEAPRVDDTPCVGREMSNPAVPNWGCAPGTTCETASTGND